MQTAAAITCFALSLLLVAGAFAGVGAHTERTNRPIADLPSLDSLAHLPLTVPADYVVVGSGGTVTTDVAQRNADNTVRQSLQANAWKGSATYQLKLASLTSTDLRTFPTERNAIAIVIVNLFPTESSAAQFQADSVADLTSLGHATLGPLTGVPSSTVMQTSHPLDDPNRPGSTLVTTIFHAAVGPATLQASFTCINCPPGKVASDQTDVFVPFVNALTPVLPSPGSSILEESTTNPVMVFAAGVFAVAGVVLVLLPVLSARARTGTRGASRRR